MNACTEECEAKIPRFRNATLFVGLAALALLGSSLGIAAPAPPTPTPLPPGPGNPTKGWEYGRLNCGPGAVPGTTLLDCLACCIDANEATPPTLTRVGMADCMTYCKFIFGVPNTPVTF